MKCFSPLGRRMTASVLMIPVSLLAALTIFGCGSSNSVSSPNKSGSLVVPDAGNNRVLIYNAPFTTGATASAVLGQTGFTTATAGTTASTMSDPSGVAFDSTGNLYTLESYNGNAGNSRVLQFKAPFTTGASASAVLGAPDFVTSGNIGYPTGVAVDKANNVWISAQESAVVVEYSAPITTGMAQTLSLGSGYLSKPTGIAFDAAGNLWVADAGYSRVVEFAAPLSSTSVPALILGQPSGSGSTTPNTGGVSATSLATPTGVVFDTSGNLWASDSGNHRVLQYKTPFSNGMAATVVVGQASFTSDSANQGLSAPSAATLNNPITASFVNGSLAVGDSGNNRTLIFASPFNTGMSASAVLGQSNFAANAANQGSTPSASTQSEPYNGGFSLMALAVVGGLVIGWFAWTRRRGRVAA